MTVVPTGAHVLLLVLCLKVWACLRRLAVGGVYQWTLAAIMVDGAAQGGQLCARLGHPAGIVWLVHMMLCAVMLYVLYRLGELLAHVRQVCVAPGLAKKRVLVEEGG